MDRPTLHRMIARVGRSLSAVALALTLATVVLPSSTLPLPDPSKADLHRATPQVNWNS
jgi:hypothetical protein